MKLPTCPALNWERSQTLYTYIGWPSPYKVFQGGEWFNSNKKILRFTWAKKVTLLIMYVYNVHAADVTGSAYVNNFFHLTFNFYSMFFCMIFSGVIFLNYIYNNHASRVHIKYVECLWWIREHYSYMSTFVISSLRKCVKKKTSCKTGYIPLKFIKRHRLGWYYMSNYYDLTSQMNSSNKLTCFS